VSRCKKTNVFIGKNYKQLKTSQLIRTVTLFRQVLLGCFLRVAFRSRRLYPVCWPSHYRAGLGPPIVYRTQSVLSETNAKGAPPPFFYPTFDSHSSGTSTGNPADQAGRIGIHNLDSTSLQQLRKALLSLPLAKASNAGSSSEKGELSTTLSSFSGKGPMRRSENDK
jgi:hypothetical protein